MAVNPEIVPPDVTESDQELPDLYLIRQQLANRAQ